MLSLITYYMLATVLYTYQTASRKKQRIQSSLNVAKSLATKKHMIRKITGARNFAVRDTARKVRDVSRDDATHVLWRLLGVFIRMVPDTITTCAFPALYVFALCIGRFLPVRLPAMVTHHLVRSFYAQASGSDLINMCHMQASADVVYLSVKLFLATRRSLGTPLLAAILNSQLSWHSTSPELVAADKQHRDKLAKKKKKSAWKLIRDKSENNAQGFEQVDVHSIRCRPTMFLTTIFPGQVAQKFLDRGCHGIGTTPLLAGQ